MDEPGNRVVRMREPGEQVLVISNQGIARQPSLTSTRLLYHKDNQWHLRRHARLALTSTDLN